MWWEVNTTTNQPALRTVTAACPHAPRVSLGTAGGSGPLTLPWAALSVPLALCFLLSSCTIFKSISRTSFDAGAVSIHQDIFLPRAEADKPAVALTGPSLGDQSQLPQATWECGPGALPQAW